jgi:hypothetical protein
MAQPNVTHEKIITNWYRRSQKQKASKYTIFDQFISLWFAFNSWGTYTTKKDKDREMLDYVKTNLTLQTAYRSLLKDGAFRGDVERLAAYGVKDMRPGHENELTTINNINDFGQVLDSIYQIRCNLFHGQKSEIVPHDKELVELAFRILTQFFRPIVDSL